MSACYPESLPLTIVWVVRGRTTLQSPNSLSAFAYNQFMPES